MVTVVTVALVVVAGVVIAAGIWFLLLRDPTAAPAPVVREPGPAGARGHRIVVIPAPSVPVSGGTVTIPEFLRRYHPDGESALMNAVQEFYRRASLVPEVADYFKTADMENLTRHFYASLMMLTTHGLTDAAARRLRTIHSTVVNSEGAPITPEIFGAVLGVLLDVLDDAGIPATALAQVEEIAPQLEEVIIGA